MPRRPDVWRLALPGFCASFVSIGIGRFAYTPLLPAIVAGGWFSADDAAYLAAANLAGYLIGVIGADVLSRSVAASILLRTAMLLATLSLLACALPVGFTWFFAWRLVSGAAGGIAMVMAAPSIFPHVPPVRRGFVAGAVFMGVGFGIMLSGTLVPLLLRQGIVAAWLGLGLVAFAFTLIGWNGWLPPPAQTHEGTAVPRGHLPVGELRGLYLIYSLNAFALVPHMIFLVDYVARGLGQGLDSGTQYWVLFGLGAAIGPLLAGRAADRWGTRVTLLVTLALQTLFIALPAITPSIAALIASSIMIGAATIGIVPLVLGQTRDILLHHPAAHFRAWRTATASFALLQALGAYSLSFLFDRSNGNYHLLFVLGAGAVALALLAGLLTQRPSRR